MKLSMRFFLTAVSMELCCIFGLLLVFHFLIIPWHVETVKKKAGEVAVSLRGVSAAPEAVRQEAERLAASRLDDIKFKYYMIVLIFFTVLTFLVLLVSLDVYRKIIFPVSLMASVVNETAPGRAEALAALAASGDEIGGLAREYARMSESAERAASETRESERAKNAGELEEKKALIAKLNERTSELSAINESLRSGAEDATRARQEAVENEARHRALAESTFDMFCETDIGGNYLYISPNNEKLLGFKPEEFIGRNFSEFVHPEDIPAAFNAFQKGLQGLRAEATLRFRHRDGHYIWIESTGAYYQTAAGDLRAIIVSRDITARRRLEEEAVRAEKLDALNKMACGIAHDFNNIITCLSGNLVLLKKNAGDAAKFEEITARMEKVVKRASELTRELAADSGGGFIEPSAVDMNGLLKRCSEENPCLARGRLRYSIEFKDRLWPVFGDGNLLARAVAGIIGNACFSTPDGGDVEIKTDNIIVFDNDPSLMKPGRYVKVSFRDSRPLTDPAGVARIFDPYYCREGQKDGLELFNAYTIVKKHDGYMTAHAYAGAGVKFEVFFPAVTDAGAAGRQSARTPAGASKKRVLLMDDDEEILNSLMENLVYEGYIVSVSSHGAEAFEKYKTGFEKGEPFDVVVLDLIVPGGAGGAETVKMLLDFDPHVRAIVSSGYSNDPVMAEHKKFGFSGVIAKPYEIRSLCVLIDSIAGDTAGPANSV